MLIIRSRTLAALRYCTQTATYTGTATLTFSFADDAATLHRATLGASIARARQARFSWVESALLDAATLRLIRRFAALDDAPVNIFAEASGSITRAA